MRKVWYVLIILFLIMLVTAGIGTGIFIRDYKQVNPNKEYVNITKEFVSTNIESINIDVGHSNVVFKKSEDSNIRFSLNGYYISTYENNSVDLKKTDSSDKKLLDIYLNSYFTTGRLELFSFDDYSTSNYNLEVYLPEDKLFNVEVDGKSITIENMNFNHFTNYYSSIIDFRNVSFNNLRINENYESIFIDGITVNEFYLENYASEIVEIKNISANKLDFDISSNLYLSGVEGNLIKDFKIRVDNSELYLENINCSNLNARIDYDVKFAGNYLSIDNLNIDGNGEVNLDNLKFKKANIDINYQEINLNVLSLGDININQAQGDTNLKLNKNESFNLDFKSYSGNLNNEFPIKITEMNNHLIKGIVGSSPEKSIVWENDNGNLNIDYNN